MTRKDVMIDCSSGQVEYRDLVDLKNQPVDPISKPIDQEKLKQILINKGIITKADDIE